MRTVLRLSIIAENLRESALGRHRLRMVPTLSLADQVDRVAQRLSDEFSGTVPDPVVRGLVDEIYGEMSSAKVTQFVPVLIDRRVRARLRARSASAA
jgi:hypothetical protein